MIETGTDSMRLGQGYFVECISNILIQQYKFSRYFTVLRQHDMENKMNKSVDRTLCMHGFQTYGLIIMK